MPIIISYLLKPLTNCTLSAGYAVAIYALSSADGPPLGNVISGFLAQNAGFRWLFWAYVS